jgi:hypothetical protein
MRAARASAGSEWAQQLPQQVGAMFSPAEIGLRMRAALEKRFKTMSNGL